MHWKTLRYFNVYRICTAGILLLSAILTPASLSLLNESRGPHQLLITGSYFLATLLSFAVLLFHRQHFNRQLSIQVLIDILALTLLAHFGDGLRSGLGIMLLVSLAGAGLVG